LRVQRYIYLSRMEHPAPRNRNVLSKINTNAMFLSLPPMSTNCLAGNKCASYE